MDPTTWMGILLGLAAIALGHWVEGGHLSSVLQPAAALIVLGGTVGATLVSVPAHDLRRAFVLAGRAFRADPRRAAALRTRLVRLADLARKEGVVALEGTIRKEPDPLLRHAVQQLVDGTPAKLLRETLETEVALWTERDLAAARVFDAAGGFAPTIGILGAVLGLMHVMQNLGEPEKLGAGIAVAFVATVYGVGIANLILLPLARKLRRLVDRDRALHEMVIEGVLAVQAAQSPNAVAERLRPYLEADGAGAAR